MGFFGFGKKKGPPSGQATEQQIIVPVDLNAAHSYVMPGASEYHSPPVYGMNPYATSVGKDLPDIKHQDAILNHFFQPPAADNPQWWYNDRNAVKLQQGLSQEHFQTANIPELQQGAPPAVQPWYSTPQNPRVTGSVSQSNYRFIRPFDQRWERRNNGATGSMASLGRAYPIGGMVAPMNFRNTFRLEPAARDTENMDLSSSQTYAPPPAVYVSPQVDTARRYGL